MAARIPLWTWSNDQPSFDNSIRAVFQHQDLFNINCWYPGIRLSIAHRRYQERRWPCKSNSNPSFWLMNLLSLSIWDSDFLCSVFENAKNASAKASPSIVLFDAIASTIVWGTLFSFAKSISRSWLMFWITHPILPKSEIGVQPFRDWPKRRDWYLSGTAVRLFFQK